jgi:hypothetical protein
VLFNWATYICLNIFGILLAIPEAPDFLQTNNVPAVPALPV